MKNISLLPATLVLLLSCFLHGDAGVEIKLAVDQTFTGQALDELTAEFIKRIEDNTATPEYVEECLAHGVNPNAVTGNEWTVLMSAAGHVNVPVVTALLEGGADANAVSKFRETALFCCFERSFIYLPSHIKAGTTILKLLCEKGANINKRGSDGRTLVMKSDYLPLVSYLIERGADLTLQDQDGNTALILRSRGDIRLLEALVKGGAPLNTQNHSGNTALIEATLYSPVLENIDYLLCAGANPLIKGISGYGSAFDNLNATVNRMKKIRQNWRPETGTARELKGLALFDELLFKQSRTLELLKKACEFYTQYSESVALEKVKEFHASQIKK